MLIVSELLLTMYHFAVPICRQCLIWDCAIGIASCKQNDDHCPHYQWIVCEECDDEKAPVGIVGPQPQSIQWRHPTRLHSGSIDSERPPRGNSSTSCWEAWNRCTSLPCLKYLLLEESSQALWGKTAGSPNILLNLISPRSSIFISRQENSQIIVLLLSHLW